jgi:hypothetical protein
MVKIAAEAVTPVVRAMIRLKFIATRICLWKNVIAI